MKIKELVKILENCDQELDVALYVNGHKYDSHDRVSHGKIRVFLFNSGKKGHVIIGNLYKKDIGNPSWRILVPLDGGEPLPDPNENQL